jgi:hypothetical protein
MAPTWNSLEIAKLVVAALTPIAVAVLGWWISRRLKRLEHLQWASQKAIEKRLAVYSKLAPALNELFCYFDFIGDWKMKDPVAVLAVKRKADKLFHVNAALFSSRFQTGYKVFIDLCFVPGPLEEFHTSATLRADMNIRKEMFRKRGADWNPKWREYFAPAEKVTSREEIRAGYHAVMSSFASELGVGLQ